MMLLKHMHSNQDYWLTTFFLCSKEVITFIYVVRWHVHPIRLLSITLTGISTLFSCSGSKASCKLANIKITLYVIDLANIYLLTCQSGYHGFCVTGSTYASMACGTHSRSQKYHVSQHSCWEVVKYLLFHGFETYIHDGCLPSLWQVFEDVQSG